MITILMTIISIILFVISIMMLLKNKKQQDIFGTIIVIDDDETSFMLEISRDKKDAIKRSKTILLKVDTITTQKSHTL